MKTRIRLMGLLLFLVSASGWGALSIKDFSFQQRWPWNGLVDITYTVVCDDLNPDGTPVNVTVQFSGFDRDRNRPVAMRSLTGDGIRTSVRAGGPYKVVWNATQDYQNFHSSDFEIRIQAQTKTSTDVPPAVLKNRYLVIDLSAGPEATTYSYRYTDVEPDWTSDVCRTTELWLRAIPAGSFLMGSAEEELGHWVNEDQHQVTLSKPYYMGVFEVTQKQWQLVMGTNPSQFKGDCRPVEMVTFDLIRGRGIHSGGGWPEYGHLVNADSFLGRLQARTGLMLDMPTESQWEYACRAGTVTALNSSRDLTDVTTCENMNQVGRYAQNCQDGRGGFAEHTRVGSYEPNGWGLYDMHGNVGETCLDWYEEKLGTGALTDPPGANSKRTHVVRGGCWSLSLAKLCRSASREDNKLAPQQGSQQWGFRIMASLSEGYQKPLVKDFPPDIEPGRYLVIDLSGGPTAQSYPHRYTTVPPDLTQDACRTTELWLREIKPGSFESQGNTITLTKPYFIGVFELTRKQWALVMGEEQASMTDGRYPAEVSYDALRGSGAQDGAGWPKYEHHVALDSFFGKLRARTNLTVDLPTLAQWLYACKAGTTTHYNSGKNNLDIDKCANMDEVGRYVGNQDDGRGGSHDVNNYSVVVGQYQPNAWGLYDMHGNLFELCLDWSANRPNSFVDPVGPVNGSLRVQCGGYSHSYSADCTIDGRDFHWYNSPDGQSGARIVVLP